MTGKEFRSLFKGTIEICYGGYLVLVFLFMAYVKDEGHGPHGMAAQVWNGLMFAALFYTVLYHITNTIKKEPS
jgi:succinate dehydrogenase hydrophobic anchor subunit